MKEIKQFANRMIKDNNINILFKGFNFFVLRSVTHPAVFFDINLFCTNILTKGFSRFYDNLN